MKKLRAISVAILAYAIMFSFAACGAVNPIPKGEQVTAEQWRNAFSMTSMTNVTVKLIVNSEISVIKFDGGKMHLCDIKEVSGVAEKEYEYYELKESGKYYRYEYDEEIQEWDRYEITASDALVITEFVAIDELIDMYNEFTYDSDKKGYVCTTSIGQENFNITVIISDGKLACIESTKRGTYASVQFYDYGKTSVALPSLSGDESDNPPDQPEEDIGYDVGQYAPDFTVSLYGSDESFTLKEHRGKLTVINFWATWCGPCVTEIPYFNELSKRDDVYVIAIHGSSTDDVNAFIENNWAGHSLAFAQDNLSGTTCLTFRLLGGRQTWPLTVIVDADGKVVYNSTQSFHSYEDLEQLVNGFLNA